MEQLELSRYELEHIMQYLRTDALPHIARLRYDAARNVNTQQYALQYTAQITHIQELTAKLQKMIGAMRAREDGDEIAVEPVKRTESECLSDFRGRVFEEPPTHISEHLFDDSDREE